MTGPFRFRDDTSFPHLKFAREHGLPYADVLLASDALMMMHRYGDNTGFVMATVSAQMALRRMPVKTADAVYTVALAEEERRGRV